MDCPGWRGEGVAFGRVCKGARLQWLCRAYFQFSWLGGAVDRAASFFFFLCQSYKFFIRVVRANEMEKTEKGA